MKTFHIPLKIQSILLLAVIIFLSVWYFSGLELIPFHPDESTYLFMSSDFSTFFHSPSALFWLPGNATDIRQHYREIDAPLPRNLIGLSRWIIGAPELQADWNWSLSWEENRSAGALPDNSQLLAGRLAASVWFPISLVLIFAIGRQIGNSGTSWIALILLATNSLVLLHTRRAMAEGPLLVMILFTVWAVIRPTKNRFWLAIPLILAISSKQSAIALLPVCLIAIFWPVREDERISSRWKNFIFFSMLVLLLFILLNPFLWDDPVRAFLDSIKSRSDLTQSQVQMLASLRPDQVMNSLPDRLLGFLAQLFLTPPAIADVGNYISNTQYVAENYLSNPLNNLWRGPVTGGILLFLSLAGVALNILMATRKSTPLLLRRNLILFGTSGLLVSLVILAAFSIPFQRYYLPIIPFICLWAALAVSWIVQFARNKKLRL